MLYYAKSDQSGDQPRIAVAQAQLGEVAYASLYAEGYALTPDQAVAFALRHVAETESGA